MNSFRIQLWYNPYNSYWIVIDINNRQPIIIIGLMLPFQQQFSVFSGKMDPEQKITTEHQFCRISTCIYTIHHPFTDSTLRIQGFFPLKSNQNFVLLAEAQIAPAYSLNFDNPDLNEHDINSVDQVNQIRKKENKQLCVRSLQRAEGRHNQGEQLQMRVRRRRHHVHQNPRNDRLNLRNRANFHLNQFNLNVPESPVILGRRLQLNQKLELDEDYLLIEAHFTEGRSRLISEGTTNLELVNCVVLHGYSKNIFNAYPLQGRDILFINQEKQVQKANAIRASLDSLRQRKFVEITLQPRSPCKPRNPLFFQGTQILCEIKYQKQSILEYFKIQYHRCEFKGYETQEKMEFLGELAVEIDQRQRQFVFCKGNNASMLIWYSRQEVLVDYVKKIQFYYYCLENNKKGQPNRVICDWPCDLAHCQTVQINSIIEMKENKFLLLLESKIESTKKEELYIYERSSRRLRKFQQPFGSGFSLKKMNTCLQGVVRLIYCSKQAINSAYQVYYISSTTETVLGEDTWQPNSDLPIYFSNYLFEGRQGRGNGSVEIVQKSVKQDPSFATIFLMEAMIGDFAADDLVCQALELLSLY